jgi:hypothetical protein
MERAQAIALAAGGGSAAAGVAAILAAQDGTLHPSALVKISDQDPLAGLATSADPQFHLVHLSQHYDGAYYYAMARDPFLHGQAHTLIDQPAYRYGHPLHGWLAGILSVGQARAVPVALLVLSLAGLAVAGWAVSRLATLFGVTPWAGLVVAASPGILFSATVDTTEAVGVALLALTFLAWSRSQFDLAALLIVAVCLDKEQYIVVPVGLALWELIEWRRHGRRPEALGAKTLAVVLGPALLASWYVYVHGRLGAWPWSYEPGNLGAPVTGWLETFRLAHAISVGDFDQTQIGDVTPVVLIAIAVILLAAAARAARLRTILDVPLLGLVLITSMQGWRTLLYPHELFRTTSVAVLLALAVLAVRRAPAVADDGDGAASIRSAACPDTR